MQVTLDIPDTFAAELIAAGKDPARVALEGLAIAGYRSGQLSEYRMRLMLSFETRFELWNFLGERNVEGYFPKDYAQQEIAVSEELAAQRLSKSQTA